MACLDSDVIIVGAGVGGAAPALSRRGSGLCVLVAGPLAPLLGLWRSRAEERFRAPEFWPRPEQPGRFRERVQLLTEQAVYPGIGRQLMGSTLQGLVRGAAGPVHARPS